jgi:hypothetical protein
MLTPLTSILISSSCVHLGYPSALIPPGLPTTVLQTYAFFTKPIRATFLQI